AERIGYAGDVGCILSGYCEDSIWVDSNRSTEFYLHHPRFAGRSKLLQTLDASIVRSLTGTGSCHFIGGASGIGKTRFLKELIKHVYQYGGSDICILHGGCPPIFKDVSDEKGHVSGQMTGFKHVFEMISDICREKGTAYTDRVLGPSGKILSLFEPSFSALPGQEKYSEPMDVPWHEARLRIFQAVADIFAQLAHTGMLMVLIDDLQWADDLTLHCVRLLIENGLFNDYPIIFAGAYRIEEKQPLLDHLITFDAVQHHVMQGLMENDIVSIASDMLSQQSIPADLLDDMSDCAGGSPFFVAEFIRLCVDEGMLTKHIGSHWTLHPEYLNWKSDVFRDPPVSIGDLIRRRFEGMDQTNLHMVQSASIFGREVCPDILRSLAGCEPTHLEEALKIMETKHLIIRTDSGSIRFCHDKIRETAYATIDPAKRQMLHRRAAMILEETDPEFCETMPVAMAHHWEMAGCADKAAQYCISGIRRWSKRLALEAAADLLQKYFRLIPEITRTRVETRIECAYSLYYRMGDFVTARRQGEIAVAEATQLDDPKLEVVSRIKLASLIFSIGEYDQLEQLADEIQEQSVRIGFPEGMTGALELKMHLARSHGDLKQALDLAERRIKISRFHAFPEQKLIWPQLTLAVLRFQNSRYKEAFSLLEELLGKLRSMELPFHLGQTLGFYGSLCSTLGEYSLALNLFEETVQIQRSIRNERNATRALIEIAGIHLQMGRVEKARSTIDYLMEEKYQYLGLYEKTGCLHCLAVIALNQGNWIEA
ncbi:MAG TPA: AAA family ATPase, partial [bacterium]|nr:AAA family ATPase [bacterium]